MDNENSENNEYNELSQKIIVREQTIRKSRLKRQIYILGAMIPIMFVVLIGYVASFAGSALQTADMSEAYATTLMASDAGGYILTAVLAFVLGALITIFCMKLRKVVEK